MSGTRRGIPERNRFPSKTSMPGGLYRDLLVAARGLLHAPGFTVTAVLSLSVGLGASAAIFSFADVTLWSPWAFREPDSVVQVFQHRDQYELPSWVHFEEIRAATRGSTFDDLTASTLTMASLGSPEEARTAFGELVSANYFQVLADAPVLGRFFSENTVPNGAGAPEIVLSDWLWRTRFGADPGIIGESLSLNTHTVVVVGVAPPEFAGSKWGVSADFWFPMKVWGELEDWGDWDQTRLGTSFTVLARLGPGSGLDAANAELLALSRSLEESHPDSNTGVTFRAFSELRGDMGPNMGRMPDVVALLALAGSLLVLLVGCGNVTSLMLARALERQRELGIRSALGAGRVGLIRAFLSESLFIAGAAGAMGILLASLGVDFLMGFLPEFPFRVYMDSGPGARTLVFTGLTALAAALVFGLPPALAASRPDPMTLLRADPSGTPTHPASLILKTTLAAMAALSFVGLTLAGSMHKELLAIQKTNVGFEPEGRLVASLPLELAGYDRPEATGVLEEITLGAEGIPGVEAAAFSTGIPLGQSWMWIPVYGEGLDYPRGDPGLRAWRANVSDGYFDVMGTRLLEGRTFDSRDGPDAPPVVVINERMARTLWPEGDWLGRRVRFDLSNDAVWLDVVGIAEDGLYFNTGDGDGPALFMSFRQAPRNFAYALLRTRGAPSEAVAPLRDVVRGVDRTIPLTEIRTLDRHLKEAMWLPRMAAGLGRALALAALMLSALGVYGVTLFSAGRRRREFGIRLALGASSTEILRRATRSNLRWVAFGLGVGLVAAVGLSLPMGRLMDFTSAADPVVMAGAAGLMIACSALAALRPAYVVVRGGPMQALRQD